MEKLKPNTQYECKTDMFPNLTLGSIYTTNKDGILIDDIAQERNILSEQPRDNFSEVVSKQVTTQKLAIQVSNKREFDSVVKYMNGRGWKPYDGADWIAGNYKDKVYSYGNCALLFEDNYSNVGLSRIYQIIPFQTFQLLTGVVVEKIEKRIDTPECRYCIEEDGIKLHILGGIKHTIPADIFDKIHAAFKELE